MKRTHLRGLLSLLIIVLTVGVFAWYLHRHPETFRQLGDLSPALLAGLLVLYGGTIIALGFIFIASLQAIGARIATSESILVTMYSSIINFFGPLQSGPAFRAVYLKRRHGIKLKDYTLATLVYYLWYAAISCLMLLSGVFGWWLLAVILVGLAVAAGLYFSQLNIAKRLRKLPLLPLGYLGLATALQLGLVAVIYFFELHSIDRTIHFSQAIIYSGAANLALFVSITPGAIGFRESFLVFSHNLHHISNSTIVAANVIDRSVYIVLLLILAGLIFGTHAQKRITNLKSPASIKAD